jgi:hypothetical protein
MGTDARRAKIIPFRPPRGRRRLSGPAWQPLPFRESDAVIERAVALRDANRCLRARARALSEENGHLLSRAVRILLWKRCLDEMTLASSAAARLTGNRFPRHGA